jgi:hypothetical protein
MVGPQTLNGFNTNLRQGFQALPRPRFFEMSSIIHLETIDRFYTAVSFSVRRITKQALQFYFEDLFSEIVSFWRIRFPIKSKPVCFQLFISNFILIPTFTNLQTLKLTLDRKF